jgi:histone demethylase JARID1
MHLGAPRIWYGVSRRYYEKFEAVLKKEFPELLENSELLHKLVTQISPTKLKAEGIPVYRCKQYPGEIIVTFPRTYFSRFDCGFSCSESVNFAPHDWLPHGYDAAELYSEKCRKTSLSFDKLLLQAAMEAVRAEWELLLLKNNLADSWGDVCGKEGILTKTLKLRVKQESAKREYLCKSLESNAMENEFDFRTKRECAICYYDLHFSAAFCLCSPNRYSCLNHIKQLCTCPWSDKSYLFRYKITDLNVLVEALEGKSNSIEKWVKENLELGFSTKFSKENNKRKSEAASPSRLATEKKMKTSSLPDDIVLLSDDDD